MTCSRSSRLQLPRPLRSPGQQSLDRVSRGLSGSPLAAVGCSELLGCSTGNTIMRARAYYMCVMRTCSASECLYRHRAHCPTRCRVTRSSLSPAPLPLEGSLREHSATRSRRFRGKVGASRGGLPRGCIECASHWSKPTRKAQRTPTAHTSLRCCWLTGASSSCDDPSWLCEPTGGSGGLSVATELPMAHLSVETEPPSTALCDRALRRTSLLPWRL